MSFDKQILWDWIVGDAEDAEQRLLQRWREMSDQRDRLDRQIRAIEELHSEVVTGKREKLAA